MAAKKAAKGKGRKTVTRAKATKKSSVRTARKAPKVGKSNFPPEVMEIFESSPVGPHRRSPAHRAGLRRLRRGRGGRGA